MGGGDLNLKKQWHPAKLNNMQEVYLAEQKNKEELRKMEVLRKEIAQEKEMQELQLMQEAAGLIKKKTERLDWMYSGAVSAPLSSTRALLQEEFLL